MEGLKGRDKAGDTDTRKWKVKALPPINCCEWAAGIIKGGRDKDKAAFLINDERLASSTAGVAAQ